MNIIRNSVYILNLKREMIWFMRLGSVPDIAECRWFRTMASSDTGISLLHINSLRTDSYVMSRNSWLSSSSEHTAWGCDV